MPRLISATLLSLATAGLASSCVIALGDDRDSRGHRHEHEDHVRHESEDHARSESGHGEARGPEEHAPQRVNYDERGHRARVLQVVRDAFRRRNDRQNLELSERVLRLAHLQLEGAPDDEIAEAARGLSQQDLVDLSARAGDLYAEWGEERTADLCRGLARWYEHRLPERAHPESADERAEVLRRRLKELEHELRQIQEELSALRHR